MYVMKRHLYIFLATLLVLGFPSLTIAGTLRLGLWENTTLTKSSLAEENETQLRKIIEEMSPEERENYEKMLKSKGFDINRALNPLKRPFRKMICLSKEVAEELENPTVDEKGCSVKRSEIAGTHSIEISSSCDLPSSVSQGKITIISSESYNSNFTIKTTLKDGRTDQSVITSSAKWISEDCGDIKPPALPEKGSK